LEVEIEAINPLWIMPEKMESDNYYVLSSAHLMPLPDAALNGHLAQRTGDTGMACVKSHFLVIKIRDPWRVGSTFRAPQVASAPPCFQLSFKPITSVKLLKADTTCGFKGGSTE